MSARVMFWGVSSTRPFKDRLPPCIIVKINTRLIVLDAGELCQGAFEYFRLSHNSPLSILISHLHGDHVYGLAPLIESLQLAGRKTPIEVVGPLGLEEIIPLRNIAKANFTIRVIELSSPEGVFTIDDKEGIRAVYVQSPHSHVSYSYIIETKEKIRLNGEKLQREGIPGRLRRRLIEKGYVRFRGRQYQLEDFISEKIPGLKIAYSGDTLPNARFGAKSYRADLLIHESTFAFQDREGREEVAHSSASEAAYLARLAKVNILVLTHFSTRYTDLSLLLEEARLIFARSILAQKGLIIEIFVKRPRLIRVVFPPPST
ncbi:MAG: MBL fold metallo-hydrolase [Infirmifilum uzonense]|uniref:MBL fold metallo-hydrolase n=1 Tax=Infirmifilum uzonense TaxID=1550241 RepID=UPI003C7179B9